MLTDLKWIADGQPWPPEDADEKARLTEHAKNRLLYNGDHQAVFPKLAAYLRDNDDDDKEMQKDAIDKEGWFDDTKDPGLEEDNTPDVPDDDGQ
mgnify:CR=1 FL=1